MGYIVPYIKINEMNEDTHFKDCKPPQKLQVCKKKLSVYIHIPFCKQKCTYCNFFSVPCPQESEMELYKNHLLAEIKTNQKILTSHTIQTLYVGGGTPSVFPVAYLQEIVKALGQIKPAEFTVEMNPESVTAEKMSVLKDMGVTRISLGMQSHANSVLKEVNRAHNFKQVQEAVHCIRQAGFLNLSLDIILGLPKQSLRSVKQTVKTALKLKPQHISAYSLMVEDGTPLAQSHKKLLNEEQQVAAYTYAVNLFKKHKIFRYEVSNFCQRGFESLHNKAYWTGQNYIGFGASAHSLIDGKRFYNTSNIKKYCRKSDGEADFATERIMLGLRMREGILADDITKKEELNLLLQQGFLKQEGNRVVCTDKGFLVLNALLVKLLT